MISQLAGGCNPKHMNFDWIHHSKLTKTNHQPVKLSSHEFTKSIRIGLVVEFSVHSPHLAAKARPSF